MKRLIACLLSLCLLLVAAGCGAQQAKPSPSQTSASVQESGVALTDPAQAYCQALLSFWDMDSALNEDIEYLAFDLSQCKLEDTANLVSLLEGFCAERGLAMLLDNYEGLNEKGYIKDMYWENGTIVTFADERLSGKKLVTEAQKWRSGLAALGVQFTVELDDGAWKVTDSKSMWIS